MSNIRNGILTCIYDGVVWVQVAVVRYSTFLQCIFVLAILTASAHGQLSGVPGAFNATGGGQTPGGGDNRYCGAGNMPNFAAASDGPATLPQTCLYTARSGTPSPGNVTFVPSGSDLNGVVAAANCGDTLQLEAGGTFTSWNNIGSRNCNPSNWLTIETSGIASLPPEGTRVTPCYADVPSLPSRPAYSCLNPQNVMAKLLVTCNDGSCLPNMSGSFIRFIGIEIAQAPRSGGNNFSFFDFGGPLGHPSGHDVIFDQVWMHGRDLGVDGEETGNAIFLDMGSRIGIIDSYFNDFYCRAGGNFINCDAKVVGGALNDPGNGNFWGTYKIVNNYMEAAGENMLEGGDFAARAPADYEIRRNYFYKPVYWYHNAPGSVGGGNPALVKNNFELKNGDQVLLEGNILENTWGGFSQDGSAFLMTPHNQTDDGKTGICPKCEVRNVTVRYNIMRHVGTSVGLQIANVSDTPTPSDISAGGSNYSIHDNLGYHVKDKLLCNDGACGPWLTEILMGAATSSSQTFHDITLNHNTEVLDNNSGYDMGFASFDTTTGNIGKMFNFTWKNSILNTGESGLNNGGGNCGTQGTSVITACFTGTVVFGNHLIVGDSTTGPYTSLGGEPASLFQPTYAGVQFVNQAADDYHLQSTSPGHAAADDGFDIGANIDLVNQFTCGVTTGDARGCSSSTGGSGGMAALR